MKTKSSPVPWFLKKTGIFLLFPPFAIAFSGFKVFAFGFWSQAEVPAIMTFAWGTLCGLWLWKAYPFYPRLIRWTFGHPVVWTSYLIAFVSLCLAPFHPVPFISFWGVPQMAEGILFYLSLGLFSSVMLVYRHSQRTRTLLITSAFVLGGVLAVLTMIGSNESPFDATRGWGWTPYYFADFLGFIAIGFFIYGVRLFISEKVSWSLLVMPILLFLFTFYFSYNKSLWYGTILILIGIGGLKIITGSVATFRKAFPYFCLLILFGFVAFLGLATLFNWKIPGTLITRGYFILYSLGTLLPGSTAQDFWTFLLGRGWGEYQEFIAPNLFIVDSARIYAGSDMSLGPNEETLGRDFFHSHNSLIEIFSALGFLGIFLFCLKIYYMAKGLSLRYTYWGAGFLLSYWLLSSFWFEMPATVPFSLLGLVLVSQRAFPAWIGSLGTLKTYLRPFFLISASVIFVPVIPVGFMTHFILKSYVIEKTNTYEEQALELIRNPWVSFDHYWGFKRTAPLMRQITFQLLGDPLANKVFRAQDIYKGNRLLGDFLFERRLGCGNLYAMMIPINIYGELAVQKETKPFFDQDLQAQKAWETISMTFYKCVPKRSDMLIPLLNNLTLKGRTQKVQEITKELLKNNARDPVGLWFSGTLKIKEDETLLEGLEELRSAYKRGINRFIPIAQPLADQLKPQS